MAYPAQRSLTKVTGTFRSKARPTHGGIDIAPKKRGEELDVYAVGKGVITIADTTAQRGDTSGRDIAIKLDGDGSIWWYGHLSHVGVKVGQRVVDGQWIGRMGTTGSTAKGNATSTGVHLHLERHYPRLNMETNPRPYLTNEPSPETYAINGAKLLNHIRKQPLD